MTAIIVTARVGASFTAVLASMKINEEVLALQTMAINPVGFLVAPRLLAMIIMVPCLTVLADAIGIGGGALVANQLFDISLEEFMNGAATGLSLSDIVSGMLKAVVNAVLICMICCYYGLITEGGPISLGRNTMVAGASVPFIDVADHEERSALYFPSDGHLNPKGSAWLAKRTIEWVDAVLAPEAPR